MCVNVEWEMVMEGSVVAGRKSPDSPFWSWCSFCFRKLITVSFSRIWAYRARILTKYEPYESYTIQNGSLNNWNLILDALKVILLPVFNFLVSDFRWWELLNEGMTGWMVDDGCVSMKYRKEMIRNCFKTQYAPKNLTLSSSFTSELQRWQRHPSQTPSWFSPQGISAPSASCQLPGTKCALLSPADVPAVWTHSHWTLLRLAETAAVETEKQTMCKIVVDVPISSLKLFLASLEGNSPMLSHIWTIKNKNKAPFVSVPADFGGSAVPALVVSLGAFPTLLFFHMLLAAEPKPSADAQPSPHMLSSSAAPSTAAGCVSVWTSGCSPGPRSCAAGSPLRFADAEPPAPDVHTAAAVLHLLENKIERKKFRSVFVN